MLKFILAVLLVTAVTVIQAPILAWLLDVDIGKAAAFCAVLNCAEIVWIEWGKAS